MSRLPFHGTCVELKVEFLNTIDDNARKIRRETFLRHVDPEEMKSIEKGLGYGEWLRMAKDWHVSYWKSRFEGKPVYFFDHSRIHHVFMKE